MKNKSNRSARIALARIYGSGCMFRKSKAENYIEKLGTIKTYKRYKQERHYTSKKIKALESLMTFHHLVHKSQGGRATVENGAIINALAHQYMHSLPRNQEEVINDYLREYKRRIDSQELPVIITDDLEAPIEVECAEISIENNRLQVKKLSKADKKREQRAKKKAEEKQKAKEKRKLQRLKKEFEDR